MDRIKKIFFSLSKTEKRYLKHYLKAFHNKGKNKALELVELIEENPELSQQEMADHLYGNPKSKAFIMLKGRLLEKMLETLSLSINFQNNPAFKDDPAAFEAIDIQKNLIYAMLLRRRGLEELAADILQKCVKQAEEHSLPEFKLQALTYLRNISANRKEVIWNFSKEIEQAIKQYETDLMGIGFFDQSRVFSTKSSLHDSERIQFLQEKTTLLAQQLEPHYSVRAHYYHLIMQVDLYEGLEDHIQARKSLEALIDLVNSQKGLKARNRLGIPYIKLASLELMEYHFEAARIAAGEALNIVPRRKANYLSAALYNMFACIYSNHLEQAKEVMKKIEWFTTQKRKTSSMDIARYLGSCIEYMQGDPKAAYDSLGDVNNLFADKGGWNIGLRIHEILLLLDMEKQDIASARIEALRKHIAKYEVGERLITIYRYLYLLERQSFDVKIQTPEMAELFQTLRHTVAWPPVSPEVIRFDIWLIAQKNGSAFYPELMAELTGISNIEQMNIEQMK